MPKVIPKLTRPPPTEEKYLLHKIKVLFQKLKRLKEEAGKLTMTDSSRYLRVTWILKCIVILMSTVHLILFVYNSVKICSYHNLQLDFGEGILLGNIRRLLEFKTIYPNIRTEPILGVYPPIYQLLSAGVAIVVGLNL